jgi:periodic tryptophan protein 2
MHLHFQISSNLPELYVLKLLKFLGGELESTKHLHYYGVWCRHLLTHHGLRLKSKAVEHMPVLGSISRKSISAEKFSDIFFVIFLQSSIHTNSY